ncbi:MAG: nucleoside-diphosphate-sugar epimerase [Pseudomonadales bacterium]|jgi:nucleoside-diphosphate-sugar epimerase
MSELTSWNNRKVLVTGSTGFIGGVLTDQLVSLGASVTSLVRKPYRIVGSSAGKPNVELGDINDFETLRDMIQRVKPEVFFHLAGEAIQARGKTYSTNVDGTRNILESLRLESLDTCLVFASSCAVYGMGQTEPFTESTCPTPVSPYANSKLAAEKIIGEYCSRYGISSSLARISNVYGGHDKNYSHLIPGQIKNVLLNKPPMVNSNGRAVCDFVYIDDIVEGLLALGEFVLASRCKAEIFNLSTGKSTSVLDAISIILDITDRKALIPILNQSSSTADTLMRTSPGKVEALLRWKAKTELRRGLEKTIAWYKHSLGSVEG